ncbi:DUF2877 domain-containing protein [Uliginosibacterium sp. sgz301328]|uniref:oxamate carbamoyltransferase subunit AllH family protein n=1 Tax=Uliginosibacterium sp. sgz301328 TaxID=3243764 RepID=UPI00359E0D55
MRAVRLGADLQPPDGRSVLRGHVQTCFAHAVHVTLEDGRLMTLLSGEAQYGMRILNIAETGWPALRNALAVGDDMSLSGSMLRHSRFALSLEGVAIWQAPPTDERLALLDAATRSNVIHGARAWLAARLAVEQARSPAPVRALWRAALDAFFDAIDALRAKDSVRLDACVRAALGLGPGLTPSADDMFAGLLIGLRMTQGPHALLAQSLQRHWHDTTRASRDVLEQASMGWTTSRTADVCHALSLPRESAALEIALAAQATIGEHSGLDTLIGLLTGVAFSEADSESSPSLQSRFRRPHTPAFERSPSP